MRSISILRLYQVYYDFRINKSRNYFEWKEIEENIAIWKQSKKMFRHSSFFFVVEFTLFIDKKHKYNKKYQKKNFGLVLLVTLWNASMKLFNFIIQQLFLSVMNELNISE